MLRTSIFSVFWQKPGLRRGETVGQGGSCIEQWEPMTYTVGNVASFKYPSSHYHVSGRISPTQPMQKQATLFHHSWIFVREKYDYLREKDNFGLEFFFPRMIFWSCLTCFFLSCSIFIFSSCIRRCSSIIANLSSA